jgi:hypothetical protein
MKIKAIPKEPPSNSKFWSSHRSGKVIAQSFLEREVTIQNYEAICSVKTDHSIMHRLKNNWYCPEGFTKKCEIQASETQIPMKKDRSVSSGMKNPTTLATAGVLSSLRNLMLCSRTFATVGLSPGTVSSSSGSYIPRAMHHEYLS